MSDLKYPNIMMPLALVYFYYLYLWFIHNEEIRELNN
jgi:hypothetical protein